MSEVTKPNQASSSSAPWCVSCFNFYGNPSTLDMCSKCFSTHKAKAPNNTARDVDVKDAPPTTSFSPAASPSCPAAPTPSSPVSSPLPAPFQSEPVAMDVEKNIELETTPSIAAAVASPAPVEQKAAAKPVPNNKCYICKRKFKGLGLAEGFSCRCDHVFCGQHRMAMDHDCPISRKVLHQEKLAKANPKVQTSKITKI